MDQKLVLSEDVLSLWIRLIECRINLQFSHHFLHQFWSFASHFLRHFKSELLYLLQIGFCFIFCIFWNFHCFNFRVKAENLLLSIIMGQLLTLQINWNSHKFPPEHDCVYGTISHVICILSVISAAWRLFISFKCHSFPAEFNKREKNKEIIECLSTF